MNTMENVLVEKGELHREQYSHSFGWNVDEDRAQNISNFGCFVRLFCIHVHIAFNTHTTTAAAAA